MKKLIAILAALTILLSLTACVGNKTETGGSLGGNKSGDVAEISMNYRQVAMRTNSGEVYGMDHYKNPKSPALLASNVKKILSLNNNNLEFYIGKDDAVYCSSAYDNEKHLENVEQFANILNFEIYKTLDGKAYINNVSSVTGVASYDGGSVDRHDHELVAERVKSVFALQQYGAYLTESGELYYLKNGEWTLLQDNVADVTSSTGSFGASGNLVLTKDGNLYLFYPYAMGSSGVGGFVECTDGVEAVYQNAPFFKKGGDIYSCYYSNGGINMLKLPLSNVDQILFIYQYDFFYLSSDGKIHHTTLSMDYSNGLENATWKFESDETYPLSTDSIDELFALVDD